MENRAAIAFQPGDWRGYIPASTKTARTPVFGKAKQLHLRALPASHDQEKERARSIVNAGCQVLHDCHAAIQDGGPLTITELIDVVEAVTASLLRDPLALPSVARLRQQHVYTYMHSVAVCGLMVALASQLGLESPLVRNLGLAGLLHDIGKASVLPAFVDKGGSLTPAEKAQLRGHPAAGYDILKDIADLPPVVLDVCLHHHERPDGSGYPHGLIGDAMSREARMASICDFYDKVTCPIPGAARWSPGQAIEYIRAATGEFDNAIALRFIRTIGTFLPGVLVRLSSERLGVILDESDHNPMHPVVAVFQDMTGQKTPWQRLSTKSDPIFGIERPENWHLDDWLTLRTRLLALSQ